MASISSILQSQERFTVELAKTAFLRRCRQNTITRSELATFVKQHYWYSRYFTRYLAALLSNLANDSDRIELTHNLFDEMGLGDAGNLPHSVVYRNMMQSMGLRCDEKPFPTTANLADTMLACCRTPDFMMGLGALCLGAERIVPEIYLAIVEGFRGIGEPADNLEFFTLHIHCDDAHSATMLRIIERALDDTPRTRTDLEYGAAKAIQARIQFFDGLTAH